MKYNECSPSSCVLTDLLASRLLACLAIQRSSNRPGRYSTAGALAEIPEQCCRVPRLNDLLATFFGTYHSPYIVIDIVLRLVNVSAGLDTRHETDKIGQVHLKAGRPTTLSGHMRRFLFYRKANENLSAPWPRVHWACVTSLTISEPQARV